MFPDRDKNKRKYHPDESRNASGSRDRSRDRPRDHQHPPQHQGQHYPQYQQQYYPQYTQEYHHYQGGRDHSADRSKYFMADQRGTARGRCRGRPRGQEQQRGQDQRGPAAAPLPTPQGAWARRPGPPAQETLQAYTGPSRPQPQETLQAYAGPPRPQSGPSRPRPQETLQAYAGPSRPQPGPSRPQPQGFAAAPAGIGRAGQSVGVRGDAEAGNVSRKVQDMAIGEGGDGGAIGRGAMRGRRQIQSEMIVTRPQGLVTKQGSSGVTIKLQANYFKLLSTTDWCLYQYRVDFAPDEDRTMVRKGLLRPHKDALGPYIFDGTVLYTSGRLPEKMELFSTRQSDEAQIRIDIKEVGDLVKGDYHYLQFFNIIMRKCLGHLNLQLVGRDYYDALAKIEIRDHMLELWPGYLTSIRQHESDILMCSEISHKVMRQQTLLNILDDCRRNGRGGDPRRDFAAAVIGQVVLTGYNNNTYRIDDVDFEVTPQSTFQLRNGENISYIDYYKNKYQIAIRNVTQPLLVSRTRPRERRAGQADLVYLVPELCRATGVTDDMRAQWQLMKALSDHMRVGPESRVEKLLAFNRRLRSEPKVVADLKEWNLNLSENLVDVPGRHLPREKIVFARERKVDAGMEADWTRELRNVNMLSCGKLDSWVLIVTSRPRRDAENFVTTLIQVSSKLGFPIPQPRYHEINDDRAQSYLSAIEEILSRQPVKLIFCVVPNNRPDRYSAIKKKCCADRPVPTQVFLAKNLTNKGLSSVATKVAIQINCKIGGAPWTVEIPLSGLMVVGFDVCHDTASKGRDYGALVASLDRSFSQYFSAVSEHSNGEELSNDLSTNMCKALHAYKARNQNALPQRIVIYRDGVGEGQVPYVYKHEVELLKKRLAEVYGDQEVKMAFIIVTKRINTRLFSQKRNPPPGTVVDDVITDPSKYDFFIVSQSVRQGSVSPTAYSVIFDTVGLDADKLQRLSYKLTHMYYNWSGTVRVPAPCQYAHKLAFLVSQSIHRMPDSALENLFYYL